MNLQGLFDAAVKPLLAQGDRAYNVDEDVCYYRISGAKCAIGHVIKDEFYSKGLENCSIEDANVRTAVALSIGQDELSFDQCELLSELQDAHDSPQTRSDVEVWDAVIANIRLVAGNNGLSFDEGR